MLQSDNLSKIERSKQQSTDKLSVEFLFWFIIHCRDEEKTQTMDIP
jgi:hypothetical protein